MNTRHGATSIFAICLSAIFALPAFAQSQTTGRIAGTVKDEKGAVIRDAEVTVINKATGEARTALADDEGNYIISFVPPGVYQVSVKANGFKKAVIDNIRVVITETASVNAELSVGVAEEAITITSAAQLAQTDGAQLGAWSIRAPWTNFRWRRGISRRFLGFHPARPLICRITLRSGATRRTSPSTALA